MMDDGKHSDTLNAITDMLFRLAGALALLAGAIEILRSVL